MAEIKSIWLHGIKRGNDSYAQVHGIFRGVGEIDVKFKIPDDFMNVILQFAQAALDTKECEIKAALLTKEATDGK